MKLEEIPNDEQIDTLSQLEAFLKTGDLMMSARYDGGKGVFVAYIHESTEALVVWGEGSNIVQAIRSAMAKYMRES